MTEKNFTINMEHGFHARPASLLTNTCQMFDCNITMQKGDSVTNPKSILGIIGIGAQKGDIITFRTEGEDEEKAMQAIETLFANEFKA